MKNIHSRLWHICTGLACRIGWHYRTYQGRFAFQPIGRCMWCHEEIVVGYADLRQDVIVYPIPPDCKRLLDASVQGYQDTYTVNEYEGELLVSPSPVRMHIRGLKIVYIRKPTME